MKQLFRYTNTIVSMPRRLQWIFVKGTLYSMWTSIWVNLHKDRLLRRAVPNLPETPLSTDHQRETVRYISKTMRILDRRAPWGPMCLNRAYVAKMMLRSYGIESTFHLGYLEGRSRDDMFGHAWLTHDGQFVTGWIDTLSDYVEMVRPVQRTDGSIAVS